MIVRKLKRFPLLLGSHLPHVVSKSNLRYTLVARSIAQSIKESRVTGLDFVRQIGEESQDEQAKSFYPILKQLEIKTEGRTHSFSLSSDTVIKYIKLGAINKNLAIQYCHYLIELCRDAKPADFDYYNVRVSNLLQYILKHSKDTPNYVKMELLVESASSSKENCDLVCTRLLNEHSLWPDLDSVALTKLLSACYKFRLWNIASLTFENCKSKSFHWTANDILIKSLSEILSSDGTTPEERDSMKHGFINHLRMLVMIAREKRLQFVTKQADLLVECLENLMVDVYKRPVIKMSGRCTHCNTNIPLYDDKDTSKINNSIREVLDRRHMGDLTLHTSKSDNSNFYQFLEDLYQKDRKPIDCVIDGLNLAFKNSYGIIYSKHAYTEDCEKTIRRHDPKYQVQVLVNAIIRSNFLERFRKILVIGKAHMLRWPGLTDFFEKNNIHFYTSDNQAKDDLFMLYAATLSPKTLLVTNDFLRDHLALLDLDSRRLLERFIDTHQVWIDNKSLKAIFPTPFEKLPYVDESCTHFHIPVIDYNKMDLLGQHEPPPHLNNKMTTWICCSTKKSPDT